MALFLMAVAVVVVVGSAARGTSRVKALLSRNLPKTAVLPKAVSMLVVAAQITELVKAVEHVSIVNVTAALLMLAIVAAAKSGTEGEMR